MPVMKQDKPVSKKMLRKGERKGRREGGGKKGGRERGRTYRWWSVQQRDTEANHNKAAHHDHNWEQFDQENSQQYWIITQSIK